VPNIQRRPMPTGGLVTSMPSDLLAPDKSPALRNVRFRFDTVHPVPGREIFAPPVDSRPRNIARFSVDDQTKWLVMLTDTAVFRWGDLGPGTPKAWYKCAGPVLTGTGRWSWTTGEDQFFFARDGSGGIWRWDGNAATAINKVPGCPEQVRFVEYFNNRLLAGSIVDVGVRWSNRVRWPVNGNHADWTGDGSGWLDFYEPEQEPIQGLRVLGSRCVVFREHSLTDLVATGTLEPVFISEQRTVNVGTVFPFTVASNGIAVFFLGNDANMWAWNGSQLTPIGEPIYKTLEQAVDIGGGYEYFGFIYPFSDEYWLWLDRDKMFIFDFLKGRWMVDDFPEMEAIGDAELAVTPQSWDLAPGEWADYNVNWLQMKPKFSSRLVVAKSDFSTISVGEDLIGTELAENIDCSIETPDQYFNPDQGPFSMGTIEQVMLVYEFNNDIEAFEIGISTDRGQTWQTQMHQPHRRGYGITSWKVTGNVWRLRIRALGQRPVFRWTHYLYDFVVGGAYTGLDQVA
jgi:hypothetical protein